MMPAWMLAFFRLTRREYFADFFITPPITVAFAIYSLSHGFGPLWLAEFAAGWVAWTFYEYALHRWGLHELPFLRDMHDLHHRNQKDYIAVPPWATLAIYAGFWLIFGMRSSAFMVGFSVGYIVYAAMHTAFHHALVGKGEWLYPMKQRHVAHHRDGTVCYGVTISFWDRLFGTESKPDNQS